MTSKVAKMRPRDVARLDAIHRRKKFRIIPRATAEDREDVHAKYGYNKRRKKQNKHIYSHYVNG